MLGHSKLKAQGLFLKIQYSVCVLLLLQSVAACTNSTSSSSPTSLVEAAPVNSVVALGRLVPDGEVIKVSVSNAQDSRLNQIFVNEGDHVQKDQVIALLQGIDRRQANVQDAEANVRLQRAELTQILQGGAKRSEIAAQQAAIEQIKAQIKGDRQGKAAAIASAQAVLDEAVLTAQRRRTLQQQGAISLSDLNQSERDLATARAALHEKQADQQGTMTTLAASLRQAQSKLTQLQEVRPLDVEIARVKLDKALIAVQQSNADLENVKVRAPISGQILRINTHIGEQVNTAQGIVELARTQQMYAVAEVYETDISRVKVGQRVTLSTEYGGFKDSLQGIVQSVSLQVGRKTIQSVADSGGAPNLDQDTRIVEVKIRIDSKDSQKVSGFTNMVVQATIHTRIATIAPHP